MQPYICMYVHMYLYVHRFVWHRYRNFVETTKSDGLHTYIHTCVQSFWGKKQLWKIRPHGCGCLFTYVHMYVCIPHCLHPGMKTARITWDAMAKTRMRQSANLEEHTSVDSGMQDRNLTPVGLYENVRDVLFQRQDKKKVKHPPEIAWFPRDVVLLMPKLTRQNISFLNAERECMGFFPRMINVLTYCSQSLKRWWPCSSLMRGGYFHTVHTCVHKRNVGQCATD